jgi:hypothetical protein
MAPRRLDGPSNGAVTTAWISSPFRTTTKIRLRNLPLAWRIWPVSVQSVLT